MSRPRRTLPATELRVHLGAALRNLAREDIVIEKGGVPVAILTAYRPVEPAALEAEYERSLSSRALPGGVERMERAMAAGWAGIAPEELVANVYRWRDEGISDRVVVLDEAEEEAGGGTVPAGQRRLRARRSEGKRVADGPRPRYTV